MVLSILRNEKATRSFARVSSDIASLRRSLTAVNASSINTSSTGSVLGDENFSFDDLAINSTAYRNAFVWQQSRLQLHDSSRGSGSPPETGSKAASIRSETTAKPTKESKKGKAITSSGDFKVIPRGPLGRLLGGLFYKEVIDRTQFESKGWETLPGCRIARITALDGPLTDSWDAPSPAKPQESEQLPFFKNRYSDDQIFSENLVEVILGVPGNGS